MKPWDPDSTHPNGQPSLVAEPQLIELGRSYEPRSASARAFDKARGNVVIPMPVPSQRAERYPARPCLDPDDFPIEDVRGSVTVRVEQWCIEHDNEVSFVAGAILATLIFVLVGSF